MKHKIPTVVGLSSLLTILGVLCLTVFSLLSLSAAKADYRLGEKSRNATVQYYDADCCAEEILSQLRSGIVPQGVRAENGVYRYACAISETQILQVSVKISGTDYEILQWQAVSVTDWQADQKLHVWEGK